MASGCGRNRRLKIQQQKGGGDSQRQKCFAPVSFSRGCPAGSHPHTIHPTFCPALSLVPLTRLSVFCRNGVSSWRIVVTWLQRAIECDRVNRSGLAGREGWVIDTLLAVIIREAGSWSPNVHQRWGRGGRMAKNRQKVYRMDKASLRQNVRASPASHGGNAGPQ